MTGPSDAERRRLLDSYEEARRYIDTAKANARRALELVRYEEGGEVVNPVLEESASRIEEALVHFGRCAWAKMMAGFGPALAHDDTADMLNRVRRFRESLEGVPPPVVAGSAHFIAEGGCA
jgi:hypothetical protein